MLVYCHTVQREHRSRKTRKKDKRLRKGEDEVSAAFREAQATADTTQQRRAQSETLEALFEIFFRVLKQCTASGYAAADRKGKLSSVLWALVLEQLRLPEDTIQINSQGAQLCMAPEPD